MNKRLLSLVLSAVLTSAADAQNLIVNGDFEAGGSVTPAGWSSPDGMFHALQVGPYHPGFGSYILQMGSPNESTVSQTFATLPGATYTLAFEYSGLGDTGYFYLKWGGSYVNIPLTGTPNAYLTTAAANSPFYLSGAATSTKTLAGDLAPTMRLETIPGLVATGTTSTITFGGKGWYEYLDNVSVVLTALPPQTISFGAISNRVYGPDSFALSATASSGLLVTFAVVSGPATVLNNTLTLTGAGDVVVRASQAGNASYQPAANVDRTFTVTKADQTLSFSAIPGQAFSFSPVVLAATSSSNLPVAFSVVSGPATANGSALTLTGSGSITVRASQPGDGNFNAAPAVDRSFNVTANFNSWRNGKFSASELLDPAVSGDSAVYSHDGLTNLVKYALGLEPKTISTTGIPVLTSDLANWIYTYQQASGLPDLSVTAETSHDLVHWAATGLTLSPLSSANGLDTWQATLPLTAATTAYFRLRVSAN